MTKCEHPNATLENPCCDGVGCACQGRMQWVCPALLCDGVFDSEFERQYYWSMFGVEL